jgi:small subunit ribosomal protein S21
MIYTEVRPGESLDSAIKRFNQAVTNDGLLKLLKERSHYEKPSVKRRRKAKERIMELKNPTK